MYNISNIIEYIKNIFFKKHISYKDDNIEKQSAHKNKCLCSIDFSVNTDNTMDIMCYWPNLDNMDETTINNIATKYAVLLHAINFGIVSQEVTSTLSDNLESNNASDRYFVYEVLTKMIDLAEKKERSDSIEPIVKPSNVFRYFSNQLAK